MTTIGGNLERKEIGLHIGVSGTHKNTEIDKATGHLRLAQVDVDSLGKPIYAEQGSWTSNVIDLGDKFKDFEKVFSTNTNNIGSSFAVLTRVSDNGRDWSDWVAIAMDGAIQSDTKQYIQVRIDLFAGFVNDLFIISKSDFNKNEFIEEKRVKDGSSLIPTLTSNTSSPLGFAFASSEYSTGFSPWRAFDKSDSGYYNTKSGEVTGFLGFYFKDEVIISKYRIRSHQSSTQYLNSMPKDWVLQGSNDTTDGKNGNWVNLDTQTNQTWTTGNTDKLYSAKITKKYYAYRINWSANNGYSTYTTLGELDFIANDTTSISLRRDYEYDMTLDSNWSDTGSLHRKKITRDDWVKIDRLQVVKK